MSKKWNTGWAHNPSDKNNVWRQSAGVVSLRVDHIVFVSGSIPGPLSVSIKDPRMILCGVFIFMADIILTAS